MDTGVDPGTAAFFVRGVLAINGHILGKEDGGGGDNNRRVEEEERLKRGADAKSNHQRGAQCNADCHNDHHLGDDDCGRKFVGDTHIVGVDLQLPACVEE